VARRLDDFVDRALGIEEILRVEEHLADCVACAKAARFESSLIAGIRARDLPSGGR
jgi:putative zinc finger protein